MKKKKIQNYASLEWCRRGGSLGSEKLMLRGGGTKAYPIINSVGWLVGSTKREEL